MQTHPAKVIATLLVSVLAIYFLSFGYATISSANPSYWLSAPLAIAYGFGIGYTVFYTGRIFAVSSKMTMLWISVVSSIIGLYFTWVGFIINLNPEPGANWAYFKDFSLMFSPGDVFGYIALACSDMVYTARAGMSSTTAMQFSGTVVTLAYILELIIVVLIPLVFIANQQVAVVGKTSSRYKKYVLKRAFKNVVLQEQFVTDLRKNLRKTVDEHGVGSPTSHARFIIHFNETAQEQYLSVENMTINLRNNHKKGRKVLDKFVLSKADAKYLMEKYHAKKLSLFD